MTREKTHTISKGKLRHKQKGIKRGPNSCHNTPHVTITLFLNYEFVKITSRVLTIPTSFKETLDNKSKIE